MSPVKTDEMSDRRRGSNVDWVMSRRAADRHRSGYDDSQTESCSWLLCHCFLHMTGYIQLQMNLTTPSTITYIFINNFINVLLWRLWQPNRQAQENMESGCRQGFCS